MAVFTAIATAIVGATFAATTIGTIVVGIISTGLAIGTAKLLGVFSPPKGAEDPGVKIQLPPATDNKVPKMYGYNYTGGIIVDAEIKNQNKTMTYAIVISETSDIYSAARGAPAGAVETWTIDKIFRGDAELVFGSGTSSHIVTQLIDPNATGSTAVAPDKKYPNGRMRVRVYAGGSSSTNQIFPTNNKVNAYGSGTGQFLNWTSANTMSGLVFAIVEIDYDPDNGFTGLDAITFGIYNNLTNPAGVFLDYLNSDRYGMGNVMFPAYWSGNTVFIGTSTNNWLDVASWNNWSNYSLANVDYVTSANVTTTHRRYLIDGALSTHDSIKTNVNKILQSSGAFLTYNNKTGAFSIVVNQAESNASLANAFVLSDDNLVGTITVTSADLFSLYNQYEVEFASYVQKDQTDTVFLEIDAGLRAPNEPDNKINVRYDMLNDRARATNLANIDLRQSRYNIVVTAKGDYTTLPIDVGDVIKLNNDTYDFNEKLFRVMRTVESEDADGMLYNDLTLLEYNASVYDHDVAGSSAPKGNTNINGFWIYNTAVNPTRGFIWVADNMNDPARQYNSNGSFTTTDTIANIISTYGVSFSNTTPFAAINVGAANLMTYDTLIVNMYDTATGNIDRGNNVVTEYIPAPVANSFYPSNTFNVIGVPLTGLVSRGLANNNVTISLQWMDSQTGLTSPANTYPAGIPINVQNRIFQKDQAIYGPGTQLEDIGAIGLDLTPGNTYVDVVDPVFWTTQDLYQGYYRLDATAQLGGVYNYSNGTPITYNVGFGPRANVEFSNATATTYVVFDGGGSGTEGDNLTGPLVSIKSSESIQLDAAVLSLIEPSVSADMVPVQASLDAIGYTTLPEANVANVLYPPYFDSIDVQLVKITKSAEE